MSKRVIFHYPLPFSETLNSGSKVRPVKILEAFRTLGYQVDVVCGYSCERRTAIRKIEQNIEQGIKYDFCYSECSTMPTALTDPDHLPRAPILDALFFRMLNKNKVKIGVFYRDIYWCFESKTLRNFFRFKPQLAKLFYIFDLFVYKKYVDYIFSPSMESKEFIPIIDENKVRPLPPGIDIGYKLNNTKNHSKNIHLLYVGSIKKPYYNLEKMFSALSGLEFVKLTLCVREDEWNAHKYDYSYENIDMNVVHASGEDLEVLYMNADASLLFFEPIKYRELAVPVKLFESLGYSTPIISSHDTWVGNFVKSNEIGWTLEYDDLALRNVLSDIKINRSKIDIAKQRVVEVARDNTWIKRCEYVSETLK